VWLNVIEPSATVLSGSDRGMSAVVKGGMGAGPPLDRLNLLDPYELFSRFMDRSGTHMSLRTFVPLKFNILLLG
jgi:hypothetical protein